LDCPIKLALIGGENWGWEGAAKVSKSRALCRYAGAPRAAILVCEFREKYGTKDVKKYYSKFDVSVVAQLT
jgi:hypothetical protein